MTSARATEQSEIKSIMYISRFIDVGISIDILTTIQIKRLEARIVEECKCNDIQTFSTFLYGGARVWAWRLRRFLQTSNGNRSGRTDTHWQNLVMQGPLKHIQYLL